MDPRKVYVVRDGHDDIVGIFDDEAGALRAMRLIGPGAKVEEHELLHFGPVMAADDMEERHERIN